MDLVVEDYKAVLVVMQQQVLVPTMLLEVAVVVLDTMVAVVELVVMIMEILRASSGGGGGSGYVHSSVSNGFTGGFSSGQNHPDRGNAGEAGQNAKVVFEGIFTFNYLSTGGNETYSVNVPTNSTSMTAKVWGAGGAGIGECPPNGTGLDGGNFSGGSGGHVEGTIPVTGGSRVVWVGGAGAGSQPSSAYGRFWCRTWWWILGCCLWI